MQLFFDIVNYGDNFSKDTQKQKRGNKRIDGAKYSYIIVI